MTTVLVDANNVRRSLWPNMPAEELLERARAWAMARDVTALLVFDGRAPAVEKDDWISVAGTSSESADDVIAREAAAFRARGAPFWLVTSDRALRTEAGQGAERVIGGGFFARELRKG